MIVVTGPPGSGTRLLCAVLESGGFEAFHDQGHGLHSLELLAKSAKIVAIRREKSMAEASVFDYLGQQGLDGFPYDECVASIPSKALWVEYEELVESPEKVIFQLAEWLCVPPWSLPFEVYDGNKRRTQRQN
jgi:hypothetical protein